MRLNTLSNDRLVSCFENFVQSERKITAQVLEYIAEIDLRKLYLEKGSTSLFSYLVKDFGYSPGAAMRRVDASRLLQELPETAEKFESGTLTLSQANQIQRASRDFKKMKCETLNTHHKRELVLQIENTTQKQTEQILATTLNLPVMPVQKETLHGDQSVTLTITFTAEQMKLLEQAQDMISHSVPNKDWAAVFTHLAKKEVARRTNVRKAVSCEKSKDLLYQNAKPFGVVAAVTTNPVSLVKTSTRRPPIPTAIRKTLLNEHAACEYIDSQGRKCTQKRFLQIDHIHSWSRGGKHDLQNLQILCSAHNRLKFTLNR